MDEQDAVRTLAKWLNEKQVAPIDRVALATVLSAWNRRAEMQVPEFNHSIGEGRFYVVRGAFWWHIRVGTGQRNIGAFYTKAKAEEMALNFLNAFRDGAFAQYQTMLAAIDKVMKG